MGVLSNLITGVGGTANDNEMFGTPYGADTIAEATLTKAQKTFSSQAVTPNLPKPKTLYFVYFHINPKLDEKIMYKKMFIQTISNGDQEANFLTDKEQGEKIAATINDKYKSTLSENYGSTVSNLLKTNAYTTDANGQKEGFIYKAGDEDKLVDYIPEPDIFKKLSFEMSKLVKSYDKPSVSSLETSELNEYNRKRLIYTGIKYKDVKISFYDVKESPVQQFFISYLKFICGDFLCKDAKTWEKPIDNNHWYNALGYKTVDKNPIHGTYYGNLNSFGLNIDSNFRLIDRISFCEYYMNKITVYTIENPVVTAIDWGSGSMGDFSANDITVTFKYEGITNDLIGLTDNSYIMNAGNETFVGKLKNWATNAISGGRGKSSDAELKYMVNHSIKKDVANFVQTRYTNLSGQIFSDIASTLKAYMNGDVKFSWNTLKNQALDTMRKYNMAGAANTIAQTEQTIKNYSSKDGKNRMKYLVNMTADPTSLIGKATSGTITANSGRGTSILV